MFPTPNGVHLSAELGPCYKTMLTLQCQDEDWLKDTEYVQTIDNQTKESITEHIKIMGISKEFASRHKAEKGS